MMDLPVVEWLEDQELPYELREIDKVEWVQHHFDWMSQLERHIGSCQRSNGVMLHKLNMPFFEHMEQICGF